jgi:hypothetical protein
MMRWNHNPHMHELQNISIQIVASIWIETFFYIYSFAVLWSKLNVWLLTLTECDSSKKSALIRASDDFWPRDPASHTIHIASVAYNTLFLAEFMQPDWDMFQVLAVTLFFPCSCQHFNVWSFTMPGWFCRAFVRFRNTLWQLVIESKSLLIMKFIAPILFFLLWCSESAPCSCVSRCSAGCRRGSHLCQVQTHIVACQVWTWKFLRSQLLSGLIGVADTVSFN